MPSITNLTLAQMQSATLAQLRTAIQSVASGWTKSQIIRAEMAIRDLPIPAQVKIADALLRNVTRQDHQPDSDVFVTRDAETNAVAETLTVTYTYYANGDLATHRRTITDAVGAVTFDQTVQYYQDGRQPVVIQ